MELCLNNHKKSVKQFVKIVTSKSPNRCFCKKKNLTDVYSIEKYNQDLWKAGCLLTNEEKVKIISNQTNTSLAIA